MLDFHYLKPLCVDSSTDITPDHAKEKLHISTQFSLCKKIAKIKCSPYSGLFLFYKNIHGIFAI